MIHLYSWSTSNGRKIHIMLEETGVPYEVHPVDIMKGEQFDPGFLAISPNNKIPAIVDSDGPDAKPISIFESGAILVYLAEKTGKLLPSGPRERMRALQWLFFQVGGIGPLFGQRNHFSLAAKTKHQYSINRYENESRRLCKVLNGALGQSEYIAGDYCIADIAIFTWMKSYIDSGGDIDDRRHLKRWIAAIGQRPAVQRGLGILTEKGGTLEHSDAACDILFGASQINQSIGSRHET